MRNRMIAALLAAAGAIGIGSAGCADRTHLTASYGRSYRLAAERQAMNPNAGEKPHVIADLDSNDAAVIAKAYRRSLAGKNTQSEANESMVVVTPGAATPGGYYVPPPSVPAGER
jgi:hypothetical protein